METRKNNTRTVKYLKGLYFFSPEHWTIRNIRSLSDIEKSGIACFKNKIKYFLRQIQYLLFHYHFNSSLSPDQDSFGQEIVLPPSLGECPFPLSS